LLTYSYALRHYEALRSNLNAALDLQSRT